VKRKHFTHEDLSGKAFGCWTVIRKVGASRNGHRLYECLCQCGNKKQVFGCHLRDGTSNSCGCNLRKGRRHKQWRGHGDISGNLWDSIKRGASGGKGRRTPILFDLTIEQAWDLFIKQDRKCALTGLPLTINYCRKTGKPHDASLDRIDSAKGYTPDNVQWVHKDINRMKNAYAQDYFIEMCSFVTKNAELGIRQ